MDLFEVDVNICNQDGICAAVCPASIIQMQKGEFPVPIAGAEELCIRCGHCVAVCPTASFSHRDMVTGKCPPIQKELALCHISYVEWGMDYLACDIPHPHLIDCLF